MKKEEEIEQLEKMLNDCADEIMTAHFAGTKITLPQLIAQRMWKWHNDSFRSKIIEVQKLLEKERVADLKQAFEDLYKELNKPQV